MPSNGQQSLLSALHHRANRQDENFTTESFVFVLRRLLEHDPQAGVQLLSFLTGGRLSPSADEAAAVSVITQVTTDTGRPDIEIRTKGHRAFIEVKTQSGLGWVGIRWEAPCILVIHNESMQVDPAKASLLGYGEFTAADGKWRYSADLTSEDTHFLSRSKSSQQRFVEEFVAKGLKGLEQIQVQAGTVHASTVATDANGEA